jgi:hypothetical protein
VEISIDFCNQHDEMVLCTNFGTIKKILIVDRLYGVQVTGKGNFKNKYEKQKGTLLIYVTCTK